MNILEGESRGTANATKMQSHSKNSYSVTSCQWLMVIRRVIMLILCNIGYLFYLQWSTPL